MKRLTINEEILLLAIWRLEENAYGVTIREKIIEYTGSEVSFGTLYNNLEKLVKKGYAFSYKGDPTAVRGGKRKVFYRITKEGVDALKKARELHRKLWDDIPEIALNGKIIR